MYTTYLSSEQRDQIHIVEEIQQVHGNQTLLFFFQSIRRHSSSNSGSLTQRLTHEGKEYTHDSIPEAWASYFESLATPFATPFSEEQLKILAAYRRSQSLPADEPDMVSEEVVAIIHSLPLQKAAGPDHITDEHLKFGGSRLPTVLSALHSSFWSYPCLL